VSDCSHLATTIGGYVRDTNNRPIVGAHIHPVPVDGYGMVIDQDYAGLSSADGRYGALVAIGTWDIRIEAAGYATATRRVRVFNPVVVDFTLERQQAGSSPAATMAGPIPSGDVVEPSGYGSHDVVCEGTDGCDAPSDGAPFPEATPP